MPSSSSGFWQNRSVFVTGHMGFKGAWLTYLLSRLGAATTGYGQDDRDPLLYRNLAVPRHEHRDGNVNRLEPLAAALTASGAETVIHMAAQPIVLTSYREPLRTFEDNIMGTANVLEAARHAPHVKAVVVVTSDKVYRNNEWVWAYRENEPLGGSDPYSASKAAAEIVTQSMIASFFSKPGAARVASARAGNVIGGGDWADHRLLPDAARALSGGHRLVVRNPSSTRPWQHVLEPLSGYLRLAQELIESRETVRPAWNFGPAHEDALPVSEIADLFTAAWAGGPHGGLGRGRRVGPRRGRGGAAQGSRSSRGRQFAGAARPRLASALAGCGGGVANRRLVSRLRGGRRRPHAP